MEQSTRDCHQIGLASTKMLPTTCSRRAINNASTFVAVIAAAAATECFDQFTRVKVEEMRKRKMRRCGALPLRRPELDLICNNNFV
jgi:hypothetical protein